MHLYNKGTGEIEWSDVDQFCQQRIPEGSTLDYKADMPKGLERTVAAMANTLGGIILIGVQEDQEAKPTLPLAGIEMKRGLAEQVMSQCVDNITPPVIPDVQLCTNGAGRALVVVRVSQSDDAPHAISNNTRVYIRTGRQNDPEELASLDRVAWIANRRRAAEEFREWLLARAAARFDGVRVGKVPGIEASKEDESHKCLLTLAVCPMYPTAEPMISPPELHKVRRQIAVRDPIGTAHEFPIQENGTINRLVEDGIIMHWPGGAGLRTYHTHLNIHGLYYFKQSLLWSPPSRHGVGELHKPCMRSSEIIDRTYCFLSSATRFYQRLEYSGPLRVRIRLEHFDGRALTTWANAKLQNEYVLRYSADSLIDVAHHTSTTRLVADMQGTILYLVQRIGWSFDWELTREMLDEYSRARSYIP